jgi:hypothetical protein
METTLFSLARDLRDKSVNGTAPQECLGFVKDRLVKNAPVDDLIATNIMQLTLEPEEAAYVLSRIATHMQSATKELGLGESNLEHIFPKKPSADWANPGKLEPFLWHIGNLTMLGKRLNGGAASKGFASKREEYKKSELAMANQLAEQFNAWGETEILNRASSMIPLVKQIWNFDNPSRV